MSLLIATCGPTGIGKTHQMNQCIRRYPEFCTKVRSVTTRPSRGLVDDEWYRFVALQEIQTMDQHDVISDVEFRGERYLLLRSEIDEALRRAPAAFMAIVPKVVRILSTQEMPHVRINCRIGSVERYTIRLQQRGFEEERLAEEVRSGLRFEYPVSDSRYHQRDLFLGRSDERDDQDFMAAVQELTGSLLPVL